ncbi:MAG: hypothetical protein ACYTFG_17040 [Planctomycetota bacterium]|jgi:hypothetical protein
MNGRMGLLATLFACAVTLTACSTPAIQVTYDRPPSNEIPETLKKVGVLPITEGKQIHEEGIGTRIRRKIEAAIVKKKYYRVITRTKLDSFMSERKLSHADFAKKGGAETKIDIVDGIIRGSITRAQATEKRAYQQTLTWVTQGPPIPGLGRVGRQYPKIKKKRGRYIVAHVAMSFELVNNNGAEIIASHEFSTTYDSRTAREYKGKRYAVPEVELPGSDVAMLEELIEKGVMEFLAMIQPSEITRMVELIERGHYTEQGVKFAKRNLVKEALEQFNLALKNEDPADAAYYDKGVMHELMGQYREAYEAYKKAYAIDDDELYLDAMERMKKEMDLAEE